MEIGNPSGTEFDLSNPTVDTGSTYSLLPTSMLERLEAELMREMAFVMADGSRVGRTIGQTWVRTKGRQAVTIVVFGDEDALPLLGAHALEGLGLMVNTVHKRLIEMEEAYLL